MPEKNIIGREREAEFGLVREILDVIAARPFERQVRSEECGCCTRELAEKVADWVSRSAEAGFFTLSWLLQRIRHFDHLPQFTLKLLESALTLAAVQAQKFRVPDVPVLGNSPHDRFCDAVEILAEAAEQYYFSQDFLLFCRIAQPILMVAPNYRVLCQKNRLEITETTNKAIGRVKELTEQLAEDQERDPHWIEGNGEEPIRTKPHRRIKRIWSGGTCEVLKETDSDEPIVTNRLKVVHYSHEEMRVYSRRPLKNTAAYTCRVSFNCIDLPFTVKVFADKPMAKVGKSDQACMERCGAPHCYSLKFLVGDLEPSPIPRYYFLSMCRDLFEYTGTWGADAFAEILCDSQWARASLGGAR